MDPRRLLPVLTAIAAACVVVTLLVVVVDTLGRPDAGTDAAGTAREATARSTQPPRADGGPAGVLAAWDRRRAAAWAAGDVGALSGLYVSGSQTGAADVALLRDYLARGLTVTGLSTQVLALRVAERTSTRLVLVVTDRVVGARAVGGERPVALPADRASTRAVVLVRRRGTWVVAEVRQASAAASTSRTSSSSKS